MHQCAHIPWWSIWVQGSAPLPTSPPTNVPLEGRRLPLGPATHVQDPGESKAPAFGMAQLWLFQAFKEKSSKVNRFLSFSLFVCGVWVWERRFQKNKFKKFHMKLYCYKYKTAFLLWHALILKIIQWELANWNIEFYMYVQLVNKYRIPNTQSHDNSYWFKLCMCISIYVCIAVDLIWNHIIWN